MRLAGSNKSMEEEMSEYLPTLLNKARSAGVPSLTIDIWKGVDDIDDNVSGVTLYSPSNRHIASIKLIQLNCDNDYLSLAKFIGSKLESTLQEEGFQAAIRSNITE